MKKMIGNLFVLILVFAGLMFVVSCAQKAVQSTSPDAPQVEMTKEDDMESQVEVEDLAKQQALEEEALEREKAASRSMFISEDIYFDYDDSSLKDVDRETLKRKAVWLNNNPEASIIIEGHCDERGTTEYNLALGDRRAESARSFLIDLGINPSRLEKISYGEEMPADSGPGEEAWAKNRRAQFTVK